MKDHYILSTKWTFRGTSNVFSFWRENGAGYTYDILEAGLYDKNEIDISNGMLYVEKEAIDSLAVFLTSSPAQSIISSKPDDVKLDIVQNKKKLLANTGLIRKALGITNLDLNSCDYDSPDQSISRDDYFVVASSAENKWIERYKTVKTKEKYIVYAKETVDEFWYCNDIVYAKTRNKAISKKFLSRDWDSIADSFFEFKSLVRAKQHTEVVFDKWVKI